VPLKFIEADGIPQSFVVTKQDEANPSPKRSEVRSRSRPRCASGSDWSGIPREVYSYRLGNRCALEWVIDQYRVTEDERSDIRSDPNREDDPEYIVRLVGQVVRVSVETVKIVAGLPEAFA
jgi:predicted helicase